MTYKPRYGTIDGLRQRIDQHIARLGEPAGPWAGMGLIDDLRVMQRILDNKTEKPVQVDTDGW